MYCSVTGVILFHGLFYNYYSSFTKACVILADFFVKKRTLEDDGAHFGQSNKIDGI